MAKIVLKSIILVFVILSIYFIANPSACSNFMMGRVTNVSDTQPTQTLKAGQHDTLFVPEGDHPLSAPQPTQSTPIATPASYPDTTVQLKPMPSVDTGEGIIDTNSLTPMVSTYSQEDIDYAVASRYVELEQEYAKLHKIGKNTAKEISAIVMDDFELTQKEWEAFLGRATASNLFEKVRKENAPQTDSKK